MVGQHSVEDSISLEYFYLGYDGHRSYNFFPSGQSEDAYFNLHESQPSTIALIRIFNKHKLNALNNFKQVPQSMKFEQ